MSAKSVLDEILSRGAVRIAVSFSPPPETGHSPEFYLDQKTGEPSGVVCELGQVLAHDLGVRPEWVDMPWPEQLPALLAEKVDLLLSFTNTPQRALQVEFVGRLLPSQVVVMLPAASPVTHLAELNRPGTRIGVWHGSSVARVARRHFPQATLSEQADPAAAVAAGQVEAAVVDAVTKIFLEQHPHLRLLRDDADKLLILSQEYGHPAIRPGDPRFLNWLRNWLDYHQAEGTIDYWVGSWWQSWMAE